MQRSTRSAVSFPAHRVHTHTAPHPESAVPILVMLLCFVLALGLIAP